MLHTIYRFKSAYGKEEFETTIAKEVETANFDLKERWYPKVKALFNDPSKTPKLPKERMESFYECLYTLISNKVL